MSPPDVATPETQKMMLVDHRHLPDTDGTVQNFQQQPQNDLLTSSLLPRLQQLHPDGMFAIGQDAGIYWRLTDPPLNGCKAPDWFYVPGAPPMLKGVSRRSYVLWQEKIPPLIVMEFVSGDGSEEHDRTAQKGKFWVYEQAIAAPYYAIFDPEAPTIELYQAINARYVPVVPNASGRYPVERLGVELGIWKGDHRNQDMHWLRFWDSATGEMLLNAEERGVIDSRRAETERKRAETERKRAETERKRAEDAESIAEFKGSELIDECERAEKERHRADEATSQRNEAATQRDNEKRRADEAATQRDNEKRRADEAATQRDEAATQRDTERIRADEAATQRDTERIRADEAATQRYAEKRRADEAAKRAVLLEERLRALGIDLDDGAV